MGFGEGDANLSPQEKSLKLHAKKCCVAPQRITREGERFLGFIGTVPSRAAI